MPKFTPNNGKRAGKERNVTFDPEVALLEIVNHWWVLVIGLIITAMLSYIVVTETYKEEYAADATFVISAKGSTTSTIYSNLSTARSLAESFKYILDSDVLMHTINGILGIDEFPGRISSSLLEDTNILYLHVTSDSPELTFAMINAIIENHHIISDKIISNASMDLLLKPTMPKTPVNSMNRRSTVIKASLLSLVGISAIIIILSALSDGVKNEEDLVNKIDADKLASLYHEKTKRTFRTMFNGKPDNVLVSNPTTGFSYSETFRLLRSRIEYLMKKGGHKVLLINSVLDGEGRSTIAANISLMLAYNNSKVLLVEGDMVNPSLERLLNCQVKAQDAFYEFVLHPHSFDTLPSPEKLPNLKLLLCKTQVMNSTELIGSQDMANCFEAARKEFDYIIVDTPPIALTRDAEYFYELADASVMVIHQNQTSAKNINNAINNIAANNVSVIGAILNDVRSIGLLNYLIYDTPSISTYNRGGYFSGFNSYGTYGAYGKYSRYGYGYGREGGEQDKSSYFKGSDKKNESEDEN